MCMMIISKQTSRAEYRKSKVNPRIKTMEHDDNCRLSRYLDCRKTVLLLLTRYHSIYTAELRLKFKSIPICTCIFFELDDIY